MLEETSQPKHAHVVIPHEVDGDLEGIARPLRHAMRYLRGDTAVGKLRLGGVDIGLGFLKPLLPQLGRHRLHAHADRPRARPFQPHRVGDGQPK